MAPWFTPFLIGMTRSKAPARESTAIPGARLTEPDVRFCLATVATRTTTPLGFRFPLLVEVIAACSPVTPSPRRLLARLGLLGFG